ILISVAYIAASMIRQVPIRIRNFVLPFPTPSVALAQLAVSTTDWMLAGSVFFVLLPRRGAPFFAVLGAFLAAQLLGLASHVPGGVGVFEGLMVVLLKSFLSSGELVPALVIYRV